MRRLVLALVLCGLTSLLWAQEKPAATREDQLSLQLVLVKQQLAQALSAAARCEAEGPQAVKIAQDAQASAQALVKALDARGLTIDQNNAIVAKPPAPAKADGSKVP